MKINYFKNTEYVVKKVTLFYIFENTFNVWLKRIFIQFINLELNFLVEIYE